MILAIDPGTRGNLGWAILDSHLRGHGKGFTYPMQWYNCVVIERPEFYPPGSPQWRRVNPNHLGKLVEMVGYIKGYMQAYNLAGMFKEYLPKEWKGQTPKDVCARRAARVLHAGDIIPAKASPDEWDAIALGLFHIGRFNPQNYQGEAI